MRLRPTRKKSRKGKHGHIRSDPPLVRRAKRYLRRQAKMAIRQRRLLELLIQKGRIVIP